MSCLLPDAEAAADDPASVFGSTGGSGFALNTVNVAAEVGLSTALGGSAYAPTKVCWDKPRKDMYVVSNSNQIVRQLGGGGSWEHVVGTATAGTNVGPAMSTVTFKKIFGCAVDSRRNLLFVLDLQRTVKVMNLTSQRVIWVSPTLIKGANIEGDASYSAKTDLAHFVLDHMDGLYSMDVGAFLAGAPQADYWRCRNPNEGTTCAYSANGVWTPKALDAQDFTLTISTHHGCVRIKTWAIDNTTGKLEENLPERRFTDGTETTDKIGCLQGGYHGGSVAQVPGFPGAFIAYDTVAKRISYWYTDSDGNNHQIILQSSVSGVKDLSIDPLTGKLMVLRAGSGMSVWCCLALPRTATTTKTAPTLTWTQPTVTGTHGSHSVVATDSLTKSLTQTPAPTPSTTLSKSKGTISLTITEMPTRTPAPTPTVSISTSISLTESDTWSLSSSLSSTLAPTTSISHIIPELHLVGKDVAGELTELAIVKGRSERKLTLELRFGYWNCGFVRRNLHRFFSDTIPDSLLAEAGNKTKPSVPTSEFMARRAQLMPLAADGVVSSVVVCPDKSFSTDVVGTPPEHQTDYLSIVFAKDEDFSIENNINLTLSLGPQVVSPDNGKGYQDLSEAHLDDHFVIRANLRKPVVTVPKAVVESATTTAAVGNIASAAAGNPAVAVQGARTSLILQMVECGNDQQGGGDEEDELEWSSYPIGVGIGNNKTYAIFAGAALLNPALVLAVSAFHTGLAFMYSRVSEKPFTTICGTSYFPAIEGIVAIPLLQPTAMAATKLLRNPSHAGFDQLACAVIGLFSCLLLWYGIIRFTLQRFNAKFYSYRDLGVKYPHPLRVFLTGPGEYRDLTPKELEAKEARRRGEEVSSDSISQHEGSGDEKSQKSSGTRRSKKESKKKKKLDLSRLTMTWVNGFFLYFDLYRMERAWYGVVEYGLTILFGILEGWEPESQEGCNIVVVLMTLMFLFLFVSLFVLRPYVSNFEGGFAFLINGVQLASAVCAALFLIQGIKPAIDIGGWTAVGGLYILSAKAVTDMGITIHDLVKEKCGGVCCAEPRKKRKKSKKKKRSIESGSEVSGSELDSEPEQGLLGDIPEVGAPSVTTFGSPLLTPIEAKHSTGRTPTAQMQNPLGTTNRGPRVISTPRWQSDLPPVSSKRRTGNSLW